MARRKKQLEFDLEKPGASFGGSLLKGNPKRRRPLDGKLPIHLTLRSSKAKGTLSMRQPHRAKVRRQDFQIREGRKPPALYS
jgi:hypothetical protein